MSGERSEAEVLRIAAEQADERRANADALLAAHPPVVESVTDRLRRTHAKQRADRAERHGQLNVSGSSGT